MDFKKQIKEAVSLYGDGGWPFLSGQMSSDGKELDGVGISVGSYWICEGMWVHGK